jgi:hypothetical protein
MRPGGREQYSNCHLTDKLNITLHRYNRETCVHLLHKGYNENLESDLLLSNEYQGLFSWS